MVGFSLWKKSATKSHNGNLATTPSTTSQQRKKEKKEKGLQEIFPDDPLKCWVLFFCDSVRLHFFSFLFFFLSSLPKAEKSHCAAPILFLWSKGDPPANAGWIPRNQDRGQNFMNLGGVPGTKRQARIAGAGGWVFFWVACEFAGRRQEKSKKKKKKKEKKRSKERKKKKEKKRKEKLSSSSPSFSSECLFFLPTFLLPSLSSRSTDVSQFVRVKEEGKQKGKPRCIFQPVAIRLCGARCEGSDCVDVSGERRSKEQWKGRKDQKGRKRKCAAVNSGGTILCDATGLNRPSLSCTG